MNNTTTITKRNLALAAVFVAATLVVGTFAATTSTIATIQSAFAYQQQKKKAGGAQDNGSRNNSNNGNTVTIEECKNRGSASGFDTSVNQECENLICTHPGNNGTCTQEGVVVTPTPPSIKKTCVECFTTLLRPAQIAVVVGSFQALGVTSLEDLCAFFEQQTIGEQQLVFALDSAAVSASVRAELIQCLIIAGLPFTPLSQM